MFVKYLCDFKSALIAAFDIETFAAFSVKSFSVCLFICVYLSGDYMYDVKMTANCRDDYYSAKCNSSIF